MGAFLFTVVWPVGQQIAAGQNGRFDTGWQFFFSFFFLARIFFFRRGVTTIPLNVRVTDQDSSDLFTILQI